MIELLRGPFVVVAAAFLGAGVACAGVLWWAGLFPSPGVASSAPFSCNVLAVQVHGTIVSSRTQIPVADTIPVTGQDGMTTLVAPNYVVSNEVESMVRSASTDPSIKALLVDIESSGGGPVAGNEIATAIRRFGKPTVALVHEMAASSGYLVAAAADTIFASEDSSVGSIGVTISYSDYSLKNKKEGVTFNQLSSGPYKDTFNPDKTLTESERALIMRDIRVSRDDFVRLVAGYRGQAVEKIDALADGSTMMGRQALENGLIDGLGGTEETLAYLGEKLGEPVEICWQ